MTFKVPFLAPDWGFLLFVVSGIVVGVPRQTRDLTAPDRCSRPAERESVDALSQGKSATSRDPATLSDIRDRVAYICEQLTRGVKIQAPERRTLAEAWGVTPRTVTEYLYEARRVASIAIPREEWGERLGDLLDEACKSALDVTRPTQRVEALTRVVEVAGRFTGSQAPERVRMEQISVQVSQELTRFLGLLAQRLPLEAYQVVLEVVRELGAAESLPPLPLRAAD